MEKLIHYVWQHRLFGSKPLYTTTGEAIQVIDVGLPNNDAGADFFNAKIRIGGNIWAGNVEIHTRSSDWKRHNHHTNTAYDTVVLHVVENADCVVTRTTGEVIPQLELHCSPTLRQDYEYLIYRANYVPCGDRLNEVEPLVLSSWMSALAMERLQEKTERIFSLLESYRGSWEEVCYVTFARNLGFGINSEPFERLARSLPLLFIQKHADSLLQVEAFLFGQAGLLQDTCQDDDAYRQKLYQEYLFLQNKFDVKPINTDSWRLARSRPANFPHQRIALLAQIIHQGFHLFSDICEANDEKELHQLFHIPLTGYWSNHYLFGQPSPEREKALSNSSVEVVFINTVAPLLYSYGIKIGNEGLCDRALELLEGLKPEYNSIVRQFVEAGMRAESALDSQALIQLKRNYCEKKKCLFCRIGHKLLSHAALRP